LHELEFGNLAQTETEDVGAYPVLLLLRAILDFGHADARAEFRGEDLRARGFFDYCGYSEGVGLIGEELTKAFTHFGFANVVTLPG